MAEGQREGRRFSGSRSQERQELGRAREGHYRQGTGEVGKRSSGARVSVQAGLDQSCESSKCGWGESGQAGRGCGVPGERFSGGSGEGKSRLGKRSG